jgi:hypothetical protein
VGVIEHLVLFKFKPGIGRDDARVQTVVQAMNRLPAQVPEIREWSHGFNVTPDPEAWDYGLRATLESEADLHAYFDHPAHVPVVRQWAEISELVFCDMVDA